MTGSLFIIHIRCGLGFVQPEAALGDTGEGLSKRGVCFSGPVGGLSKHVVAFRTHVG